MSTCRCTFTLGTFLKSRAIVSQQLRLVSNRHCTQHSVYKKSTTHLYSRYLYSQSPRDFTSRRSTTANSILGRRNMGNQESSDMSDDTVTEAPPPKVTFTEDELKSRLTKEQYNVTQHKGTERAFTGEYVDVKDDGTFLCVVCGCELFKSDKKFNSGTGWPSFSDIADKGNVVKVKDVSHGMIRVEVICTQCGSHLGHVFNDGPKSDTGLRYCINSASLKFEPIKK